ncbi:ABC transporter permease [Pararobbsia alpina]|uniref:Glutathione transport system permease protein GsiD n=1 Tax=Pararobbsia alpina TaxID=621374 RepID=A0A6S7B1J1_9BURK|nr:ABC transporter permease [Pararobbsia alpina]CAB3776648.1 Glutathione transport system permease protein GsiD [Pararobbsia alpina]
MIPPAAGSGTRARSSARSSQCAVCRLLRSASFDAGALLVLFWFVCAIMGTRWLAHDPFAADPLNSLMPPSYEHWFGTDSLGRDVFARVVAGARDILTIAPLATLLGTALGTLLGLVTGYWRGWVDDTLGRLIDATLALPLVIVALLVLAAVGTSNLAVIIVIGLVFAPIVARTVRIATLNEVHLDYVAAARLRGDAALTIMLIEVLPNVMGPILVEATIRLGYAIFTVATLSFLGFGIQPPSPDWGLAIAENYPLIAGGAWWTVVFDAIATASLVFGVNLLADGVRAIVDR